VSFSPILAQRAVVYSSCSCSSYRIIRISDYKV